MSSLEAQSLSRKEKLAKLKQLKKRGNKANDSESNENDKNNSEQVQLVGRNYDPETRTAKSGFEEPPTLQLGPGETVELVSEELERETLERLKERGISKQSTGLDLESLQPKRANWDLKRDIQPQLDILEAETQNAIARMVRERLKAERESSTK